MAANVTISLSSQISTDTSVAEADVIKVLKDLASILTDIHKGKHTHNSYSGLENFLVNSYVPKSGTSKSITVADEVMERTLGKVFRKISRLGKVIK